MLIRNSDNNRLASKGKSSVCKPGIMNMGDNPRVHGGDGGDSCVAAVMPERRSARNYLPSHKVVLETLLKCVPKCLPNERSRGSISQSFYLAQENSKEGDKDCKPLLCRTPVKWITTALAHHYVVNPVKSLDDIMGHSGMASGVADFFLMDVILNRELLRSTTDDPRNVDDVVMATAKHDPQNLQPSCDFKYRTLVAFLPGAGVF